MRGKDHVMLSMATGFLLVSPLLGSDLTTGTTYFIVALLSGIFIGSLLPDVDASDAKINHLEGIAWLFGFVMRPLILPIVRFIHIKAGFDFDYRHRQSVHTIFSIGIYSIILLVLSFFILMVTGFWSNFVLVFYLGLFLGGVLHLVEDCCTVSGLRPFAPISYRHFSGGISTTNAREDRPELFSKIQLFMAAGIIGLGVVFDISVSLLGMIAVALVGLSWMGIYGFSGTSPKKQKTSQDCVDHTWGSQNEWYLVRGRKKPSHSTHSRRNVKYHRKKK